MKLKSLFTAMALTIVITLPMTAMSKTTPIVFAKGSNCSSYSGNVIGKKFTLFLKANQELSIDVSDLPFNPIVYAPQGKLIIPEIVGSYKGDPDKTYHQVKKTPKKGIYTIVLKPEEKAQYADVEFCVY